MTQVNNIKVRIKFTVYEDGLPLDISIATTYSIIIQKPDGTTTTYPAIFLTDGTDGVIYYDTVSGDLDQSGLYRAQGHVEITSGSYKTNKNMFRVECNL